jgi:hypothetical protein
LISISSIYIYIHVSFRYEEYGGPIQDTYDGVVGNTLSLLKGWTLDERAARIVVENKIAEETTKKTAKGQFQSLKAEK